MNKKDILFLLSGSLGNQLPKRSLGGVMSRHEVGNSLNNLFSDVTTEQTFTGYTDYRCFYVFNDSEDEKLKDMAVWLQKELSGSQIEIGLSLYDETQVLIIRGKPENGRFQLVYRIKHGDNVDESTTREIIWEPDVSKMALRIRAIINSLDYADVDVVGSENDDGYDFLIQFVGKSGGRVQELLQFTNNVGVNGFVQRSIRGGPINSVAPDIGFETNTPNGVIFFQSNSALTIEVGTLFPGDFMPVWLKRIVKKNTKAIHPDKFKFHMLGDPGKTRRN